MTPPPEAAGVRDVLAAVARSGQDSLSLEPLLLDGPRADEVRVRIVATGLCHTDAAVRSGAIPCPSPIVLGHEGAGVVEAVGAAVAKVSPGDHVVMTFDRCGGCPACRSGHPAACPHLMASNFRGARADGSHALRSASGEVIHDRYFGQSAFATFALAHERNVVPVPRDLPLEELAPLGCGVLTGAGTVMNVLDAGPQDSLAVFGAGGVGMAAVMAAAARRAAAIVVVDLSPERLDVARELGATHLIRAGSENVLEAVGKAVSGGVTLSFDTTGRPEVMASAVKVLTPGGRCALVSGGAQGTVIPLDANDLIVHRKQVLGVMEGDADPDVFIPELVALYRAGKLPLGRLIGYFNLQHIDEAFAAARSGRVIKPVIRMGAPA